MRHNIIETLVGAAVLAAALIFVSFAYSGSQMGPTKATAIAHASFSQIDGLAVGGDVRISGVKVGTIGAIRLDPETYMAVVDIHYDPQVALPTDTSAAIVSSGLLGGKYISLAPGADDTLIANRGYIQHTQSAVNLEALIGQAIFSSKSGA